MPVEQPPAISPKSPNISQLLPASDMSDMNILPANLHTLSMHKVSY